MKLKKSIALVTGVNCSSMAAHVQRHIDVQR
jgi:hypothetical protein